MSSQPVDRLFSSYLRRLESAAAVLPPRRRKELLEEIRQHLDTARDSGEASDDASAHSVLDRLGDPHDIARAAADEPGAAGVLVTPAPGTGIGREIAAALLTTFGSVLLPLFGWLVGVYLMWKSTLWTTREKFLGTLVLPFGPGGVLALGAAVAIRDGSSTGPCVRRGIRDATTGAIRDTTTCTGTGTTQALPHALGVVLLVAIIVLPLVVAGDLVYRAHKRARQRSDLLAAA